MLRRKKKLRFCFRFVLKASLAYFNKIDPVHIMQYACFIEYNGQKVVYLCVWGRWPAFFYFLFFYILLIDCSFLLFSVYFENALPICNVLQAGNTSFLYNHMCFMGWFIHGDLFSLVTFHISFPVFLFCSFVSFLVQSIISITFHFRRPQYV